MSNSIGPNDPLGGIPGFVPQTPASGGAQTPGVPFQLGGDVQSSGGQSKMLYSLESSLANIVNQQGSLKTEDVPSEDIQPLLQLLAQTTEGQAKPDELSKDLMSFLKSEDKKADQSGGHVSQSDFHTDFQNFMKQEDTKYGQPDQ